MRGVLPVVSIVGVPNVGKSTLFNRLIGQRRAIVHKTPGVTRDRNLAETDWNGVRFLLVDTGGLKAPGGGDLETEVEKQVRMAIAESDLILFLVDGRSDLSPIDQEIAKILRKEDCPLLLVANKVEKPEDESTYHSHSALGLGEPVPISAQRGINCGDLMDTIVGTFPESYDDEEETEDAIHVAVVGRPNAGKSSLINRICGEDRLVVFHEAGTTRDSIDTRIVHQDQPLVLIDTAGLRRKNRIEEDIEYYANVRVIRSIDRSDIVVLLVEGPDGLVKQDATILSLVERRGKGMVIAYSKWDRVQGSREVFQDLAQDEFPFVTHIPFFFTSSVTGEGITELLDGVLMVGKSREQRVSTPRLNRLLQDAIARKSPPSHGTRMVKLFYISQVRSAPPEFVIFSNSPRGIKGSYDRYLTNFLRDRLDLNGVPIRIQYRDRKRGTRIRK